MPNMGSSEENYSGGSYPPSLYDTSVSSASASRRNTAPAHSSFSGREDPHYMHPNRYSNDYHDPQWRNLLHSNSPRSMEDSRYKYNRDVTAMSDPGVARLDENYGRNRSRIEYAQSEIGSPSAPYYESHQRSRIPSHYFQDERHTEPRPQYSQGRYSPAAPRRKSFSPPNEHQRGHAQSLLHQIHSREEVAGRGNFSRANENYYGDMRKSLPSYNGRSFDATSPASAENVKELKRQLWNNGEVSNGRGASDPRYDRRSQQSLSPERRSYRRRSPPPSSSLPRFARSLSPRRRQYQPTSIIVDVSPSPIQKANSTISDTSYNSRFHSKFIEAALMAQKNGNGNNKAMENNEAEYSLKHHHMQQYRQQKERRRHSLSSRPLNEGSSYQRQNLENNKYRPPSPHMQFRLNKNYAGETRNHNTEYYRGNESHPNPINGRGGGEAHRPPIIPPSPSYSPAIQNNERPERLQQKYVARGIDSPQFRRSDGSARRMRPPSPLLLDRIRSFEQDYHHDSFNGVHQGHETVAVRHDSHVANDSMQVMSDHDNVNHSHDHELASGKISSKHYVMHDERSRRRQQEHFDNEMNHFDGRKGHAGEFNSSPINMENGHGSSQSRYQEDVPELPHNFSSESARERMAYLVEKLSAVNRADPKSALAEIDSILRQESRSPRGQSFENHSDSDKKNVKAQGYSDEQPEPNLTESENKYDKQENNHDDDQSDVSSLTNPVFGPQGSSYKKNTDSLYIQESDRYNLHPTQSNNLTSFNPSTSSFRRPRPSHLQNYSNDTSKEAKTLSRSEWKRQQLEKFPPPSTITLKDDQTSNESSRQSSEDVREMMLQKNLKAEASRSKKSSKTQNSRSKNSNPKKKLGDKIVNGQEDHSKKVRSWGELSNSLSRSHSEQEDRKGVRKSIGSFSKPHPWDTSPSTVVETKDTSMEDAMGVEAEISIREPHSYMRELDMSTEISVEGSKRSNSIQGSHFERARKNIKQRSDNNPFNDPSVDSSQSNVFSKARFPDISDSVQGDSVDVPNIQVSMKGIPQFDPSHRHQAAREGQNRVQKKSEGERNSWADVPHPSSYFPDINDNFEPISGMDESRSISRLACTTVVPEVSKPKEKKRGFLNKFMDKKKSRAQGLGYTASASAGFPSAHSTSLESRGVKSTSHIPSSTRSSTTEPFHIMAAPPGVLEAGKQARGRPGPGRRNNSRGRSSRSASAPRNRSKSSDKFRSNSMAQKFNRVMQLYDSDET